MIERARTSRVFVGRQAELEALEERRRLLARASGSVVLIRGEAGVGKSCLLQRFLDGIPQGRPRLVARTECLQYAPRTLGPWRDIVARLASAAVVAAGDIDEVTAQALAYLAPAHAKVARDESLGKAGLLAAVARLLWETAAKRATIIAIEDIHWADVATVEMLAFLSARVRKMRVLIVATLRDGETLSEDAASALGRVLREPSTIALNLRGLPDEQIQALLLSNGFDAQRLGATAIETLVKRADGNPLFAEELLRDVRAHGVQAAPAVPTSVHELVKDVLRRLPSGTQRIVQQSAVLGERVSPSLIAKVIDEPLDLVVAALDAARDAGLLVDDYGRQTPLRFRHALTRDAIVAGMLAAQAALTHERAAIMLERAPEADRDLEALAYHWWEANDRAKVREYSERAGDAAFQLKAYDDARRHLERALDAVADEASRARIFGKLGHAARARGYSPRAVDLYSAALERYRALGDAEAAADIVSFLAVERSNAGASWTRIARMLEEAEAEFGDRLSPVALARLRTVHAQFLVFDGKIDDALRKIDTVDLRLPLTAHVRSILWTVRCVVSCRHNDVDGWLRAADSVANVRVSTDASARINIATMALGLGETGRAIEEVNDAVDIARRWRLGTALAHALFLRSTLAYVCGRIRDAGKDLEEGLASHADSMHVFATFIAPLVAFAGGGFQDAERTADWKLIEREGNDASSYEWQRLSATAAVLTAARGNHVRAREIALSGVSRLIDSHAAVIALPIAASLIDASDEQRLTEAAERVFGGAQHDAARGTIALSRAVSARKRGDATSARDAGSLAREAYARIGWSLYEAIAMLVGGETDDARTRFRAMHATGEYERWMRALSLTTTRAPEAPSLLSSRERAVADLIASGASNAAIGLELNISQKTVEKYVTSIFAKRGFHSRAQIAAFVAATRNPRAGNL